MAGRADPLREFPGEVAGAAREIKYDVTGTSRWLELLPNSNDVACDTDIESGTGDSRVLIYNYKKRIVS